MLEITAIIAAVVFLLIAILALGKMYDAQRERDFLKDAIQDMEEDWEEIKQVIGDPTLSDNEKIQKVWELI